MSRWLYISLTTALVALAAPSDAHPVSSDPYAPLLSMGLPGFDVGAQIRERALSALEQAAREQIARDGRLAVDERARAAIVARLDQLDPVTAAFYARRRYLPAFVSTQGLTPAGSVVLDTLMRAPEHGLASSAFGVDALAEAAGALSARVEPTALASRVDDRFVVALIHELALQGADAATPVAVLSAADRIGHSGYRGWYAEARAGLREELDLFADDIVSADLQMTEAAVSWMRVMRWDHDGQHVAAVAEWHPGLFAAGRRPRLAESDLLAMVDTLSTPASQLAEALASVPPQRSTYRQLQRGLARYRDIEAAGGWTSLGALDTRTAGSRGDDVLRLRARLAAEGFLADADGPATYDAGVELAVAEFQRTRGLEQTGDIDDATLEALDVPLSERLATIELGLRRLRESRTDHEARATLVRVNIPGYRAEVWRGAELLASFDVMVGRPFGPNPTPVFSDVLDYMELNPYWYAPLRLGRGGMAPGPNNPMGQVKFIFSNPWAVYLHDTNQRELFERPERAISSGCVRVREPLDLAALLRSLDRDIDVDSARDEITDIIDSGATERLHFVREIGVHLEYVLVDAESDGTVLFHRDLYDLEAEALSELARGAGQESVGGPT